MSASGVPPFEAIAIVGLGLIGGSVAKAVRNLGLAGQIFGYDNNAVSYTHLTLPTIYSV